MPVQMRCTDCREQTNWQFNSFRSHCTRLKVTQNVGLSTDFDAFLRMFENKPITFRWRSEYFRRCLPLADMT